MAYKIDQEGQGVVGRYIKSIAEAKRDSAIDLAREAGFPFEITIERDKRKYLLCNNNSIKILYYSNIKEYCEINTMEKLLNEILKHETVHITT